MNLDDLKLEAQQVLDELMRERHLPFRLTAHEVTQEGAEYCVRFFDSRLRSITVTLGANESFKDIIRAAVLARVRMLSKPLHMPKQ